MAGNQAKPPIRRPRPAKKPAPKVEKKSPALPASEEVIRAEPISCLLTGTLDAALVAEKKAEVVKRVRSCYAVGRVLRLLGIPRRLFNRWIDGDDEFAEDLQLAQQDFVDEMEARLIKMAKGGKAAKKGDYMALISFLNASHLSYGRIRAEMMEKALVGFIDLVIPIVASHVPKELADTIRTELMQAAVLASYAQGGKRSQRAPTSN